MLGPPDVNNRLIKKDSDAGKDWRQKEKRATEDEMVEWHHRFNGHELVYTLERWWGTGRPGVLQSMGSQRVGQTCQLNNNNWKLQTATNENISQFSHSVMSDSLWPHESIAACQDSLSITNSWSLWKLMSIVSVMPSSYLILYHLLLLLPPIPPSIRVFSNESALHMRWPKYWSFSFSIIPSNEHPGLISFRIDWLDLLAVQGTLKSLLQHHSSKASIFRRSAFFTVQLSQPYMIWSHDFMGNRWGNSGNSVRLYFLGAPKWKHSFYLF